MSVHTPWHQRYHQRRMPRRERFALTPLAAAMSNLCYLMRLVLLPRSMAPNNFPLGHRTTLRPRRKRRRPSLQSRARPSGPMEGILPPGIPFCCRQHTTSSRHNTRWHETLSRAIAPDLACDRALWGRSRGKSCDDGRNQHGNAADVVISAGTTVGSSLG